MTTATARAFTPLLTPFGFVRQPTAEECELVGRSTSYSEPFEPVHNDHRDLGDYVIAMTGLDEEQKTKLLEACEALAIGDEVHDIPTGIYVEE